MKEYITKHSVVQVNENGPEEWIGCLLQVQEVKEWGVQAWIKIPFKGNAYLRLTFDKIDFIGYAVMSPQDEVDEPKG